MSTFPPVHPLGIAAPAAPAAVVVARSAFRAGSLAGVRARPSAHSFSGFVLACAFRSPLAARAFAARWGCRLSVFATVRRVSSPSWGVLWVVSVPVAAAAASSPAFGFPVCWVGGVRGFAAAITALGVR